eukprot:7893005-Lingulodinium_polyedra.AAC.1
MSVPDDDLVTLLLEAGAGSHIQLEPPTPPAEQPAAGFRPPEVTPAAPPLERQPGPQLLPE